MRPLIRQVLGLRRDLLQALRFLTRFPVPGPPDQRGPGKAMGAFPLVGLVLGLSLALIDQLAAFAGLGSTGRDALLVVAWVAATGGLHLDGLMDSCDGLFGGRDPEHRLAIMRDTHLGSFGVLGGACVLLLKFGLLGSLGGASRLEALLLAPVCGRWSLVLAAALFPPARPGGFGAAFRAGVTPKRIAAALATTASIATAIGPAGVVALLACCIGTWRMGRAILGRIPGLTGDSYGAIAELNEVLVLLVVSLGVARVAWW